MSCGDTQFGKQIEGPTEARIAAKGQPPYCRKAF
jgi:hypothetical protein